ncbi:MAG TPA: hypothetical protein VFF40_07595 [Acidimicrobiia bacterium]|nr:hypothetical protein [Acidimicrobiia bacterium]
MSILIVVVIAIGSACLGFLTAAAMAAAKLGDHDIVERSRSTGPTRALPQPSRN